MLEKTGTIILTSDDLKQAEEGIVSDRVKQTWGLTLQQLKEVIDSKSYASTVTPDQDN